MLVSKLKKEIEVFQSKIMEHRDLWGKSLSSPIPNFPVKNKEQLEEQSRWLSRKKGMLQPFLDRFFENWIMRHPATGVTWNALDAATGLSSVSQIKGPSMRMVSERMDQLLGKLDGYDLEDDIPKDASRPIKPGIILDQLMYAYLSELHPYINRGCSQLFVDGHYAQAVEESAKAVFQYIREKTGLKLDGSTLVDNAFSINKPLLSFSDLSDQNKKNEQTGFSDMLKGFAKGVRNPLTHTHGHKEDALKAFEYLVVASLFCRRIDDASLLRKGD